MKFIFTSRKRGFSFGYIFFLSTMTNLPANISAPSPLIKACDSTSFYYAGNPQLPSIKCILCSPNINEELLSPLSRVTMQVCFLYFSRITEVISATVSDIIEPDRVVLHGAKRSNSYVIYLPGLSAQVCDSNISGLSIPLFPISYTKLYRDAVRVGISIRINGSKNVRRLHCARYVFSQQSINSINGPELAGVLRHRSIKNYSSYLK